MVRVLSILLAMIGLLHGLIHLLGFVAYWPVTPIAELPYKTVILGGQIDLGARGMRVYSLLWLAVGLGFIIASVSLGLGRPSWTAIMLSATILSIIVCILDWKAAFRGVLIDVALLLVLGVVFGLRLKPAPFPAYSAPSAAIQTIPLPQNLPKPVERFYRQTYGDQIPVYTSAVITGRGFLRLKGIEMPTRVRFTHLTGQGYRHYIETTFFGIPLLKVNERYLDQHARLELLFGVTENEPRVDSAANQGLWAETMAFPAVFLTDPRVRWEAVDDNTARVYVPFRDDEQAFTVTFDITSGLMIRMETTRYRDEKSGNLGWWGEVLKDAQGHPIPNSMAAVWADEDRPWLEVEIEDIVYNSDVSFYIRQKGP